MPSLSCFISIIKGLFSFIQKGDIVLALEDYKKAAELQPSRTEAMFNIGQYYFNQK